MSIKSIAVESERKSSFHQKFKNISDEVSAFANEFNLEIKGEYNCYFIDFSMSGKIDDIEIKYKSHKKQKSTFTGVIPTNAVYEDLTEVEIELVGKSFKKFSIEKTGFFSNIIYSLKKVKSQKLSDDFVIYSKDRSLINSILQIRESLDFILSKNVSKFEVDDSGKVKVKLYNFFETKNELNELLEFLQLIINRVS